MKYTSGLWGPTGLKIIEKIGRKIKKKKGNKNAIKSLCTFNFLT
jgi:hypothetical protein